MRRDETSESIGSVLYLFLVDYSDNSVDDFEIHVPALLPLF